jgi:nitroimidazol reductase NimA-like FMN-containing flavoprotein (pyridoxamine 5'-phosphate oxidase superfamily)
MEPEDGTELAAIRDLFERESLAVLSTQKESHPYASLVAFAVTPDMRKILFLTPSTTRKYENLTASPRVAALVNNSRNRSDDVYSATAVTALGSAEPLRGEDREKYLEIYLKPHPHLGEFAAAPTTELIGITVDKYIKVSRFQSVTEIRMSP